TDDRWAPFTPPGAIAPARPARRARGALVGVLGGNARTARLGDAVAAVPLGFVERGVGSHDDRPARLSVPRELGDADAHRDLHRLLLGAEPFRSDALADALGDPQGVFQPHLVQ